MTEKVDGNVKPKLPDGGKFQKYPEGQFRLSVALFHLQEASFLQ